MKKIILFITALFVFSVSIAQTYIISNQTVTACGGTFYDDGGASQNYLPNQSYQMTFCSGSTSSQVQLLFSLWDVQSPLDLMYVYDGADTTAPLIATYTNGVIPNIVRSNNNSGCLTIVFTSANLLFPAQGWAATVMCVPNSAIGSADSCQGATPYCSNLSYLYQANYNPNGTGTPAQSGPDYGCLFTQPNPSWFYFQIAQTGDFIMNISSMDASGTPHDVDFICWGPFTSPTAPCGSQLTAANTDSCSYSPSAVEELRITNAQAGSYYLLLVTNFANVASNISMSFDSTSTATTNNANCISTTCAISSLIAKSVGCNGNTYNAELTIITSNPPTTGTLTVKSPAGNITLSPPFNDTIVVNINNVPYNYMSRDSFSAVFSADTFCKAKTFILPAVFAGPDRNYCTGAAPVGISVIGQGPYHWSPTTGIISSNADSSSIVVMPSATTTYIVTGNSANLCKYTDTVVVNVLPAFTVDAASNSTLNCLGAPVEINVRTTSTTGMAPFIYQWRDTLGNTIGNDSVAYVTPTVSSYYYVNVYSAEGCIARDSVYVSVTSVPAPLVIATADKNYVCPGTPINLSAIVSSLSSGLTPGGLANACSNLDPVTPYSVDTVGDLVTAGSSTIPSPFRGFWHDGRVQYLYRASELQALGMKPGTITGLVFWISTKSSTAPYNGFTIKMTHTSLNQLPNTFVGGLSTVLNPTTYNSFIGANAFSLDNPYDWDGFSNLIVEVCFDNGAWTSSDAVFSSTVFAGATLWDEADNAVGCTLAMPTLISERPIVRFEMCLPALTNYSYEWTPSTTVSCDTCLNTTAILNADQLFTLKVTDINTGCIGGDTIALNIDAAVKMNVTPQDTAICSTDTIQLKAVRVNPIAPACQQSYSQTSIPYNALSGAATNVTWTNGDGDEDYSTVINIPFTFNYFCSNYNQLRVSTNGYIALGNSIANVPTFMYAQTIPDPLPPNNYIALCSKDLDQGAGGNVSYFTAGTAPNRVFVIRWTNVPRYSDPTSLISGEIHLNETTNFVEIHTLLQNDATSPFTQGLENANGSAGAVVAGRNNQVWTVSTPEGRLFTPNYSGSLPLSYSWTPVAPATGTQANIATPFDSSSLAVPTDAMQIAFAVTFSSGCIVRDTVNITKSVFPYTLSATPSQICPGDSSQLLFTNTGISPLASINWTPAPYLNNSTIANPTATVINDTKFYVTATNTAGCSTTDSVTVTTFKRDSLRLSVKDTTICPGSSVSVSINDPSAPFAKVHWYAINPTYTLVDTNNLNTIVFSQANSYQARIWENGCSYLSDTFTLRHHIDPVLSASADTVCPGQKATFTALTTGLSNYVWNSGQSGSSIQSDTTAYLFYTATDIHGCTWKSDSVKSGLRTNPGLRAYNDTTICAGDQALLTSDAGYSNYVWSTTQAAPSITVSTAGSYYYQANDRYGCRWASDTAVVTIANLPVISFASVKNPKCPGESVVLNAGSQAGVAYNWNPGGTGNTITVTSPATYNVTATVGSCSATGSITITESNSPTVTLPANQSHCICDTSITVTPTVNAPFPGAVTYNWSNSTAAPTASVSSTNTLTLTVTDANGCTAVSNATTVSINCLKVSAGYVNGTTITPGNTVELTVDTLYVNGTYLTSPYPSSYTYSWTPTAAVLYPSQSSTGVNPDSTTQFTLLITDPSTGCQADDTITVYVVNNLVYRFPTAFTPNGDGKNETYYPVTNDPNAQILSFNIYNQWNQLVYSQVSPWDGNYMNTTVAQPIGVYIYYVSFRKPDPNNPSQMITENVMGTFTLIR